MLNKLLIIIRKSPNGLTLRDIMKKAGSRAIATDLARLIADGKVERVGDKYYPKGWQPL